MKSSGNGVVVIIGAGKLQVPYFSFAKKYNLKVALTDKNPNCESKHLADYFLEADGTDIEKIKSFVLEIAKSEKIIGVHCGSDFGLRTVATLCECLDIKYTSLECIENSLNKNKAKKILQANNILVPNGRVFEKVKDALDYFNEIKNPVIIKPTESSGSQGVSYVDNKDDFIKAFTSALQFSKKIVVEEYIAGRHIDANGFLIDSKFFPLGTDEREFFNFPYAVTLKAIVPAPIDEKIEKLMYNTLQKTAMALKIKNGPIKADFILKGNDLYLIEVGPRFHGDIYSTHLSAIVFEKCLVELFFQYISTGIEPEVSFTNKKAGLYGLFANPGHILKINGLENALSLAGIKDIIVLKESDFTINHNMDNNSLIGYIIGESLKYDDLSSLLTKARKCIHFKYAQAMV